MNTPDIWRAWRATPAKAAFWSLAISVATVACDSATSPNGGPDLQAPPVPAPVPAPIQPAEIIKISGDRQSGRPGDQLQPIIVAVRDRSGERVAGATVTFLVTAGDGYVGMHREVATVTNGDGEATIMWRLGRAGQNTLLALVKTEGKPLQASFLATSLSSGYPGGSFALTPAGTVLALYDYLWNGPLNCTVQWGLLVLLSDGAFQETRRFDCGFSLEVNETGFYRVSNSTMVLHYLTDTQGPWGFLGFFPRDLDGTVSQDAVVVSDYGVLEGERRRYTRLD